MSQDVPKASGKVGKTFFNIRVCIL